MKTYILSMIMLIGSLSCFGMNNSQAQELAAIQQREKIEQESKVLSRCKSVTDSYLQRKFMTDSFQKCAVLQFGPYAAAEAANERAKKQERSLTRIGSLFNKIGLLSKMWPTTPQALYAQINCEDKSFNDMTGKLLGNLCERFDIEDAQKEKLLYCQWFKTHGNISATFDYRKIWDKKAKLNLFD